MEIKIDKQTRVPIRILFDFFINESANLNWKITILDYEGPSDTTMHIRKLPEFEKCSTYEVKCIGYIFLNLKNQ